MEGVGQGPRRGGRAALPELFEPGAGDYAAERDTLFADMSLDDWVATIRARENASRFPLA